MGSERCAVGTLPLTVFASCESEDSDSGKPSNDAGPVITAAGDWESTPAADMRGRLVLKDGCLQIGDDAIFWLHGTRWDQDAQGVVLTDGSKAIAGRQFHGGGGVYDTGTDFADLLDSNDAANKLTECVDRTGGTGVRLLTP
ncbi:hypothetical protein GCM10009795_005350 [Nocardioides hankookensis]|uniref:Uncharacterized protein n=1 Tax=Nocardioides hankookensis TaxID=443157 RepID=A0ABW1LHM2_9ACTN